MESEVTTELVFRTLSTSLSQDNAVRFPAETQLRKWETESVPGFIGSLLRVALETQSVEEVCVFPECFVFRMCVSDCQIAIVAPRDLCLDHFRYYTTDHPVYQDP